MLEYKDLAIQAYMSSWHLYQEMPTLNDVFDLFLSDLYARAEAYLIELLYRAEEPIEAMRVIETGIQYDDLQLIEIYESQFNMRECVRMTLSLLGLAYWDDDARLEINPSQQILIAM